MILLSHLHHLPNIPFNFNFNLHLHHLLVPAPAPPVVHPFPKEGLGKPVYQPLQHCHLVIANILGKLLLSLYVATLCEVGNFTPSEFCSSVLVVSVFSPTFSENFICFMSFVALHGLYDLLQLP